MDELLIKKPIKVLMVSPWSVACGIATYSQNLIEQLEKLGVQVEIFSNTKDYSALVKLARETACDVVHFQHEYGVSFLVDALMSIMGKFRMAGRPVVLTLHTEDDGANVMLDGSADAIILHNDGRGLHQKNTFSRFLRIPHGIPEVTFPESRAFYRKKYGIPEDAFVIGTCGFMSNDRGNMLETVLQQLKDFIKDNWNVYLHFVMSAHRSDAGGHFAKLIRGSLTNIANSGGFADRLQVTTEFVPTEEFRERIHTFDLGFAHSKSTVISNSGAAADIISCGVPVVVNNVPHFSHIAPYCSVVEGDLQDITNQIRNIYCQTAARAKTADTLEALVPRTMQAVKDLGYSVAAAQHKQLYGELLTTRQVGQQQKPRTKHQVTLNKDRFVSLTMPNSFWQVLVAWTRIQRLVQDGHNMQLLIQNDGLTDINLLKYALPGLADIKFVDAGLKHDPRIVRLQSYSLAQNMTVDVEAWFRDGRTYEDLLSFLGQAEPFELKLGQYAERQAQALPAQALVLVASEKTRDYLETSNYTMDSGHRHVAIIGTPLTEGWVYEMRDLAARKAAPYCQVSSHIEDLRTCLAYCRRADSVVGEWGTPTVFSLIDGTGTFLVGAEPWQKQLAANLTDLHRVRPGVDNLAKVG